MHQDPILSRLKLIAEPWDPTTVGQQLGNFPVLWSEWNAAFRDAVRAFWKGDACKVGQMAFRLTGSADIFQAGGRRPHASINFVTAHDGFTLHDLVSYDHKHNEANLEDNRDGIDDNLSWNHGVEGETDDKAIVELRERSKRNMIATMFLARGVPMLSAGDEIGRTQRGNNNAYCQDNELSWVDWELTEPRKALLEFTSRMAKMRHAEGVLHEDWFFQGEHISDSRFKDLTFFRTDGKEMSEADWKKQDTRSFAYLLGGDTLVVPDRAGHRPVGDTLLMLLNGHHEEVVFHLPEVGSVRGWDMVADTAAPLASVRRIADGQVKLMPRSLVILRLGPQAIANPGPRP